MNPGDRHWKQAYRALSTILPPSKFHGKPANSLYYTLAAMSMDVNDPGATSGRLYLLVEEHVLSEGPEVQFPSAP